MSSSSASIISDNTKLDRVNDTKFLWVKLDENLIQTNRTETISKNISRGLVIINKLKHFVPERVLSSSNIRLLIIIRLGLLNSIQVQAQFKLSSC